MRQLLKLFSKCEDHIFIWSNVITQASKAFLFWHQTDLPLVIMPWSRQLTTWLRYENSIIIAIDIIVIALGYLPVSTSQEANGNHFNSPLFLPLFYSLGIRRNEIKYFYNDLNKHMYILAVNTAFHFAFPIPHGL